MTAIDSELASQISALVKLAKARAAEAAKPVRSWNFIVVGEMLLAKCCGRELESELTASEVASKFENGERVREKARSGHVNAHCVPRIRMAAR